MKTIRILGVVTALSFAGTAFAEEGSCAYVQENMFAGPFNVCEEPLDAGTCAVRGETDDNADAVHSEGACTTEALVGTCDLGDTKLHYYTGDAESLEIGCGFQSGEWVTAE